MPEPALLKLDHVHFQRDDHLILNDISWSLNRGEHWALLGPNGSGKTTLLQVACGFLWPTCGTAYRLGKELIDLGQLRRQIGWISVDLVSQIPRQDRVLEMVAAGRLAQIGFKNLPSLPLTKADYVAAKSQLKQLECSQFENRLFGTLSQGEKQKVLIARARMAEPLLLILDEPCAGMDPGARERFLKILDRLASSKDSPTIVLVTHHVEEIMPSIHNTLVLREGRILRQGPTLETVDAKLMSEVYGVAVDRIEMSDRRMWPIWK